MAQEIYLVESVRRMWWEGNNPPEWWEWETKMSYGPFESSSKALHKKNEIITDYIGLGWNHSHEEGVDLEKPWEKIRYTLEGI